MNVKSNAQHLVTLSSPLSDPQIVNQWQRYQPVCIDHPALQRIGGLVEVCRVVADTDYYCDQPIQDWLVLPLHDASEKLTGFVYLSPDEKVAPPYYPNPYHPSGGLLLGIERQQPSDRLFIVSDPLVGFMLACANLSVIISFTPEHWRGVSVKAPMNLYYQAADWSKKGYSVCVPVDVCQVNQYKKWLDETSAQVLGVTGLNGVSMYEQQELAEIIQQTLAEPEQWPEPESILT